MTSDDERRRHLRLAQAALDTAKGLLRNVSDKLTIAADQLALARDDDQRGEHQRNP
jgi:hypothetical protein